jgi:hypothetical protein
MPRHHPLPGMSHSHTARHKRRDSPAPAAPLAESRTTSHASPATVPRVAATREPPLASPPATDARCTATHRAPPSDPAARGTPATAHPRRPAPSSDRSGSSTAQTSPATMLNQTSATTPPASRFAVQCRGRPCSARPPRGPASAPRIPRHPRTPSSAPTPAAASDTRGSSAPAPPARPPAPPPPSPAHPSFAPRTGRVPRAHANPRSRIAAPEPAPTVRPAAPRVVVPSSCSPIDSVAPLRSR